MFTTCVYRDILIMRAVANNTVLKQCTYDYTVTIQTLHTQANDKMDTASSII
jgi:hypothetical protein